MQVHSGEQNHKCHVCGVTFKQFGSLKSHVSRHREENEGQCSICGSACESVNGTEQKVCSHCHRIANCEDSSGSETVSETEDNCGIAAHSSHKAPEVPDSKGDLDNCTDLSHCASDDVADVKNVSRSSCDAPTETSVRVTHEEEQDEAGDTTGKQQFECRCNTAFSDHTVCLSYVCHLMHHSKMVQDRSMVCLVPAISETLCHQTTAILKVP